MSTSTKAFFLIAIIIHIVFISIDNSPSVKTDPAIMLLCGIVSYALLGVMGAVYVSRTKVRNRKTDYTMIKYTFLTITTVSLVCGFGLALYNYLSDLEPSFWIAVKNEYLCFAYSLISMIVFSLASIFEKIKKVRNSYKS